MFLFGVTGGIGSGKSTVCDLLRAKGIPIIEADPLAKELTNRLPEIQEALKAEFGADIYFPNGLLNKAKLTQLVFTDSITRRRINGIIHPHVLKAIKAEAARLETQDGHHLIGVEAALIFEAKMENELDAVIVVDAPEEIRMHRIGGRDHLKPNDIRQRMDSQMRVSEKRRKADYLIDNIGSLVELSLEVDKLYDWLASKA
ncbi:dephospho-CoA kinase [bacterium]|nr:dephospho-CoA kinase [bacterium]